MDVKFVFALNWPHLVCRQIIGKRCLEGHHSGNVGGGYYEICWH